MLSSKGIDQLKKDEGIRLKIYKDSLGNSSIGYGFNLGRSDSEDVMMMAGIKPSDIPSIRAGKSSITKEQADAMFDIALSDAHNGAKRLVEDWESHPQGVKDTLVNMSYQLGTSSLRGFSKMLDAVNSGDYSTASKEIMDSEFAKNQTPKRAKRHSDTFNSFAVNEIKEKPSKPLTSKEAYKRAEFNRNADMLAKTMDRESLIQSLATSLSEMETVD